MQVSCLDFAQHLTIHDRLPQHSGCNNLAGVAQAPAVTVADAADAVELDWQ